MRKINRDSLPHLVRCGLEASRRKWDSLLSRLLAAWWGVKLGRNCTFFGLPYFRRTPHSRIVVGPGGVFLSAFRANLHGVDRPCMISTLREGAEVRLGDRVGLSGTVIACARSVTLGNRVMCGANTTITDTDSHHLDFRQRHPDYYGLRGPGCVEPAATARVVIEDDVWLGMRVTVLKGVTIGAGTVVGACSVVSRSLPAGVVAVGVPAKPVAALADRVAHGAGLAETLARLKASALERSLA